MITIAAVMARAPTRALCLTKAKVIIVASRKDCAATDMWRHIKNKKSFKSLCCKRSQYAVESFDVPLYYCPLQ